MSDDVSSGSSGSLSRRYFARNIMAAAAIAAVPDGTAAAEKITPSPAVDLGSKPEGLSVADWSEVQSKYANLLRVYGERLSSSERHTLVNILTTSQRMLVSIRSFEVQNGDPSACTLRVYEPRESVKRVAQS